ncbi:MAG TPA: phage holin family protein [Pyrinomonadaceae bacterium]|nr:phage holin family protein [Pyrinomonadaceae bacterium]
MAATNRSLAKADDGLIIRSDTESLPNLLSRLGDDVMQLINSQLALFKVEIKEEASAYARNAAFIAVGGVVAAIGFALLNVAIAFGVSTLFASANFSQPASYALGFVVTGVFYLLVGGIVVLAMKNRLARQQLVPPMTAQELRKDKQWLKSEL